MEYLVLIVDDDPEEQLFFNEALKKLDNNVKTVSFHNGDEALKWLESNNESMLPDFILLDINMPRMSGFALLKAIKENWKTMKIPVYMFSTSDWEEDRKKASGLGASGYFSKPYTIGEYSALIASVLYKNQKQ